MEKSYKRTLIITLIVATLVIIFISILITQDSKDNFHTPEYWIMQEISKRADYKEYEIVKLQHSYRVTTYSTMVINEFLCEIELKNEKDIATFFRSCFGSSNLAEKEIKQITVRKIK